MLAEARHVVLPEGIATTGFPAVRETCRSIGITFDPWQVDLNRAMLGKTADGLYAADTVVLSIPRQVGKTFDVGAVVFALCIANPGLTVVWTAHRFKVSRETFNELRGWAKRAKLRPHIDYDDITTAAGNECIPFRNGSRIVFAARERGAVRGFTKVGLLVLDEAQILTESVLADLVPTMNQAPNPLIIMMGTPPKPSDPGEVFTTLRKEALDGSAEGVLYVELSAPLGSDPDDRDAWRVANPSYPSRTPERAILRLRKLLTEANFLREALGIWDPADEQRTSPIDLAKWAGLFDRDSPPASELVMALDASQFGERATIATAGTRPDGLAQVEIIENRSGTAWLASEAIRLWGRHDFSTVLIDPQSPAAAAIPDLAAASIPVRLTKFREVAQACASFVNHVESAELRHGGQRELDMAAGAGRARKYGDAWVFSNNLDDVDPTPLRAACLAVWGLRTSTDPSVYEERGLRWL